MSGRRVALNMILGPIDETWLLPALDNVAEVVEVAIVHDNGGNPANAARLAASRFAQEGRLQVIRRPFQDFATARNDCLDATPPVDWILRLDADEVHYPEGVARLVSQLPEWAAGGVATVRVPFYHLLSHKIYQSVEDCAQFFRWHPSLHWRGAVHETLGNHGAVVKASDYFIHYSYCQPQPVVFQKWEHYSALEGDPDHYTVRGTQPETVIADRYAQAGAPFTLAHPPGAAGYWAAEVAARRQRDVPFKLVIVIHGDRADALSMTLALLQQSSQPDYPLCFVLAAPEGEVERLSARHGHEAQVEVMPAMDPAARGEWLRQEWAQRTAGADWGSVLFMAGGAFFSTTGWQKALVNALFCLPGYDAYRPVNARHTLLVAREALGEPSHAQTVYASPYVLVNEEHL